MWNCNRKLITDHKSYVKHHDIMQLFVETASFGCDSEGAIRHSSIAQTKKKFICSSGNSGLLFA